MRKRKKNKYGIRDQSGNLIAYDEEIKFLKDKIKVSEDELSKMDEYIEADRYACFYNNPWMLYYENGREMNFIDALRIVK